MKYEDRMILPNGKELILRNATEDYKLKMQSRLQEILIVL